MTLTTAVPSAGWFPDPGDPAQERWWSGKAWTEHYRALAGSPEPAAEIGDQADVPPATDYVFGMTDSADAAAADTEPAPTPASNRPKLPSFEELLAASRVDPEPADTVVETADEVAVESASPGEQLTAANVDAEWTPRAYGATDADGAPVAAFVMPTDFPPLTAPEAEADSEPEPEPLPEVPDTAAAPLPTPSLAPAASAPTATVEPSAPAAAPAFVMPSTFPGAPAAPLTPPAPLAASSAEMPALPGALLGITPPVPAAPAGPAPVGFTTSTDPTIANRYRAAVHHPDAEAAAVDPFAAQPVPPVPTPSGSASPDQPGWQGMPLPAAGAAFHPTAPSAYQVKVAASSGGNKTALTALGSGALAVGLAVFFLFFDRIGLWPGILGIAAVVQGIIGAVHSRKVRSGLAAALGGIVLGLIALGILITAAVSAIVNPEYMLEGYTIEQEILTYSNEFGVDAVNAVCPDELTGTVGSELSCTAYDASGAAYPVTVSILEGGYFQWTIDPGDSA